MTSRTFVTIGAGQAAAVAARTLRRRGFDGRIVLIGDEPHAPYQRPPLSKEFLAGSEGLDSLTLLPQKWLDNNDIEIVTGTTVTRVDPASRSVELDGAAPILADAVLFATGGRPRTVPVPGPRPDLVHYLRTLDDARRLQHALAPGKRLVVVGAGFIGLELAATATAMGVEVTVVEAAPIPLGGILGEPMGQVCMRLHRSNGVDLRTGTPVDSIRTTADGVLVELGDNTTLAADLVVIGIGIEPNVTAAAASGLRVDNGIVVDAQGRTDLPNIFAAGDVARRWSDRAGRHVRLEHFDNANKQGVAAANAMLGRDAVNDDAPWFWSDQYTQNLQLIGNRSATGEVAIRGSVDDLDFTAFYLDGDTVCGAFTIDRGEDVMAVRELLGRRIDPAVLTDEDTDLWDLLDAEEPAEVVA
ncbi:MAG TPA: FAD-dependent oxidoreductase [Aldersonia sp.]